MDKTSKAAGLNRCLRAVAITIAVAAILAPLPVHGASQRAPPAPPEIEVDNTDEDCFITDPNGRKWPCSRINNTAFEGTLFELPIENRLSADMRFYCDNDIEGEYFDVKAGETTKNYDVYTSVFDPAPRGFTSDWDGDRMLPNVTCQWECAGNSMKNVVVWDERWPEAWSCRKDDRGRHCKLVFESNREVVLVSPTGRRVLGDLAIKDCSKNLWGLGGWIPFGLACTYPKHDHPYYGKIG